VPGIPSENYWFRRHEAAYAGLLPDVGGRTVLEVGCGEGYGTARIAAVAKHVLGIDYDEPSIRHAAATYPQAAFARANLAGLPIGDGAIEVVATLQVIEHVWDHPQFVRECARVLRPGGTLVVTTPNRLTFSPGLDRPVNPFHTHEFTAAELTRLLSRCGFIVNEVRGLHAGARLTALEQKYGSFTSAQLDLPPEAWSAELTRDVAAIGIDDFDLLGSELADVDACLDLVVVAAASG
jgi:SAM-dependent methyltransferase